MEEERLRKLEEERKEKDMIRDNFERNGKFKKSRDKMEYKNR